MRAVVVTQHGGPEVLVAADHAAPQAGPGRLLVDVAAAGVNYMDIYQRQGRPPYAGNLPYVPGAEGAGTVAAAGPGVSGFAVGDKVAWTGVPGSYAEQIAVPAGSAVPVPAGIELRTAAAVMLQGMTAHYLATSTYPVADGDHVVVHAAAGGVGLLLTQLARMRGGVVIGTTSSTQKAVLARHAGASYIAGYDTFAATVREVTGGAGAAAVYDGVGAATFDDSLAALRPRGYMVLYGAAGGSLFITRPTLGSYIASRDELLRRAGELFSWIRQGKLEVRIGGSYPLDDAARAHQDLSARRTTGKLLVLPSQPA